MTLAGALPHVPFAQACELAANIAAMPVGHQMNSACSTRTAAATSLALQSGIPDRALRIVGNFLPDLSARAVRQAQYGEGAMLYRTTPFSDASFLDRVFAYQAAGILAAPKIDLDSARLGHGEYRGMSALMIERRASGHRWLVFEPFSLATFYNHHALGVRTQHPLTGRVETMPIDPTVNEGEPRPMDMPAWRNGQHYLGAIPMVAMIGEPFQLDVPNMDEDAAQRLAALLDMPGASRLALGRRMGELPSFQRLHLLRAYFHLHRQGSAMEIGRMALNASAFFEEYADRLATVIATRSNIIENAGQLKDPGYLRDKLDLLRPLQETQEWLLATNDAPPAAG